MSRRQRHIAFLVLVALTLVAWAIVATVGPTDIVAFQLDRTSERAAARVLAWSAAGELDGAIASHQWDFALMALYGLSIAWGVVKARRHLSPGADSLGRVAAVGAIVAAGLDAVENVALLRFIDLVELPAGAPPPSELPALATTAATLKFALIVSALIYAAFGLVAWRRARASSAEVPGDASADVAADASVEVPAAPRRRDDAPDIETWAAAARNCDLIMKGGITSGVIYPRLATRLATRYRFRNIGGTSAGAIAAAATAAAEYARQRGRPEALDALDRLPDELGSGLLLSLFRPSRWTRPLLELFLAVSRSGQGMLDRLDAAIRVLVRFHLLVALAGLAAGLVLGALLSLPGPALDAGLLLSATTFLVLLASLPTGVVGATQRLLIALPLHLATGLVVDDGRAVDVGFVLVAVALLAWGVAAGRSGRTGTEPGLMLASLVRGSTRTALLLGTLTLGFLQLAAWSDVLGAAPLLIATIGLVVAGGVTAVVAVRRADRALTANGAGVVTGMGGHGEDPAVTEWLTELLDDVAFGPQHDGPPLTFSDLAGRSARSRADGADAVPVNLEVMGTDLTTTTAHRLPFRGDRAFVWSEADLAPLFPPRVVAALRAASSPVSTPGATSVEGSASTPAVAQGSASTLLRLDDDLELPVVVAVRISMGFPVLFAPVPLRVEAPAGIWSRAYWGDGGAASNLPVHFFDALIPRWPTFAVDLRDAAEYTGIGCDPVAATADELVVLRTERPREPLWLRRVGVSKPLTVGGVLGGFLAAATDWHDNVQLQADGYWDRVVHVLLRDGEGGLNLAMDGATIDALAERGEAAAQALLDRFDGDDSEGWRLHRWLRYRLAMAELEEELGDLTDRLDDGYRELLEQPPREPYGWVARQGPRARHATLALETVAARWLSKRLFTRFPEPPEGERPDEPHRRVELRVTPRT
ncbi:MAG: patatin-like phospholipase family protein [Actinobacteria bacterium]|nr:patatin-like phospholipase family protein [Actinomycetota bacterium]